MSINDLAAPTFNGGTDFSETYIKNYTPIAKEKVTNIETFKGNFTKDKFISFLDNIISGLESITTIPSGYTVGKKNTAINTLKNFKKIEESKFEQIKNDIMDHIDPKEKKISLSLSLQKEKTINPTLLYNFLDNFLKIVNNPDTTLDPGNFINIAEITMSVFKIDPPSGGKRKSRRVRRRGSKKNRTKKRRKTNKKTKMKRRKATKRRRRR